MANSKKIVQAAAGNVAGAGLNVEEIFINYLWEGNDATRTITNGIDLSNEGGMLWIKARTSGEVNWITDSERTLSEGLSSNSSSIYSGYTNRVTSYTSSGFTLGAQPEVNALNEDFVSWCFRKAEGFFDVVTWTGDGTSGREIAHNLGTTVGSIFVKQTDNSARKWAVYHREMDATNPSHYKLHLNTTDARANELNIWNDTEPTSTHFTVGSDGEVNGNGGSYVAYVFAHNDGDGEFGPDGDADIIKCGSYAGNGSTTGPSINLGFEPQWLLIKKATASGTNRSWWLADSMRGFVSGSGDEFLQPNSSAAESGPWDFVNPTATGFQLSTTDDNFNTNNIDYIYIAIRRGPMAVPESATDVFQVGTVQNNTPKDVSPAPDFPVDFVLHHAAANSSTGNKLAINRLATDLLYTNLSGGAYGNYSSYSPFDHMDNVQLTGLGAANGAAWMWKRAPNFFDVVAYTGTGSAMTLNHNLGVTPEMIWTKRRDSTGSWLVYHSATGLNKYLSLNSTAAVASAGNYYAVSDTTFGAPFVNSGGTFISYLFASLDGISKVGSVTIQSGSTTVDCGFSSGPRFVLLKRTDGASSWNLFDSERGIVAGNDPYLNLNQTAAEITGNDLIDPTSSGFTLTSLWTAGQTWIYYAIA